MEILQKLLSAIGFGCLAATVLVAPWLFGAWEMWWFWLFALGLFFSTLCWALRLLLASARAGDEADLREGGSGTLAGRLALLFYLPFLAYACVRFVQAPVFMDAERSFLLFGTPVLIGLQVVLGFSRRQQRLLAQLVLLDLCLIGLYGIINYLADGGRYVMWEPAYPQYVTEQRASGCYYCPNHYAGALELAFGLAAALLVAGGTRARERIAAGLVAGVAATGVVFSKSRGGGVTILLIGLAVLVWGLVEYPRRVRWMVRGAGMLLMAIGVAVFCYAASGYMQRFRIWLGPDALTDAPRTELLARLVERLRVTDRGRMVAGAVRAWKTAPMIGIGPGMHQNLWPHVAASPDGSRDKGIWPSLLNNEFHSYEVHSDWVQLLEEYGIVGFVLFLGFAVATFAMFLKGLRRLKPGRGPPVTEGAGDAGAAMVLGGVFAWVAMGFHSLGDFNLQMPATVWLFAVITALALAHTNVRDHE